MKTFVLTLTIFSAVFAAALVADVRASLAYQSGDAQWCAVTDKGDLMAWECEYDSNQECVAAIASGGGYCAINPY